MARQSHPFLLMADGTLRLGEIAHLGVGEAAAGCSLTFDPGNRGSDQIPDQEELPPGAVPLRYLFFRSPGELQKTAAQGEDDGEGRRA